jgi:hypothetical protein
MLGRRSPSSNLDEVAIQPGGIRISANLLKSLHDIHVVFFILLLSPPWSSTGWVQTCSSLIVCLMGGLLGFVMRLEIRGRILRRRFGIGIDLGFRRRRQCLRLRLMGRLLCWRLLVLRGMAVRRGPDVLRSVRPRHGGTIGLRLRAGGYRTIETWSVRRRGGAITRGWRYDG